MQCGVSNKECRSLSSLSFYRRIPLGFNPSQRDPYPFLPQNNTGSPIEQTSAGQPPAQPSPAPAIFQPHFPEPVRASWALRPPLKPSTATPTARTYLPHLLNPRQRAPRETRPPIPHHHRHDPSIRSQLTVTHTRLPPFSPTFLTPIPDRSSHFLIDDHNSKTRKGAKYDAPYHSAARRPVGAQALDGGTFVSGLEGAGRWQDDLWSRKDDAGSWQGGS